MTAHLPGTLGAHHTRNCRHVDEILALGQQAGASDIHLGVNSPPVWRLNGTLQPIWPSAPRLTADETAALTEGFVSDAQRVQLKERGHTDFAYATKVGRF